MKIQKILIILIWISLFYCVSDLSHSSLSTQAFGGEDYVYITDEAGRHFNSGLDFQNKGDDLSAISQFEIATKLRPNFPRAYLDLGYSFVKLGKLEDAIKVYHKAIYYDPSYEAAYFSLGLVYMRKNDSIQAIESFNKVLSLNSKNDYARHNLWKIYVDQKQFDKAEKVYQEILVKQPGDWYARLKVAQTFWIEGRRRDAFVEAMNIFRYPYEEPTKSDRSR